MSDNEKGVSAEALEDLFDQNNQQSKKRKQKFSNDRAKKRELALAATVLLVDLADCDQDFDPEEYQVITSGLIRMFDTCKSEVTALVNEAQQYLANLRGVDRYAQILKEELNDSEKAMLMDVIDELTAADGKEDGFEIYLRSKVAKKLGMSE